MYDKWNFKTLYERLFFSFLRKFLYYFFSTSKLEAIPGVKTRLVIGTYYAVKEVKYPKALFRRKPPKQKIIKLCKHKGCIILDAVVCLIVLLKAVPGFERWVILFVVYWEKADVKHQCNSKATTLNTNTVDGFSGILHSSPLPLQQ